MKKDKKLKTRHRVSTTAALLIRVGILLFALWLVAMSYLTVLVATDLQRQWEEHANSYCAEDCFASLQFDHTEGFESCQIIEYMHEFDIFGSVTAELPLYQDPSSHQDRLRYPDTSYEVSMVFFDGEGNVRLDTGNYMTFDYITEEVWFSGTESAYDRAYVNLDAIPGGHFTNGWAIPHITNLGSPLNFQDAVRLTGYFEGGEFKLLKLSTYYEDHAIPYTGSTEKTLGQFDAEGKLDWVVAFDETAGTDRELVDLYAERVNVSYFTPSTDLPVEINGRTYEDLNALLTEIGEAYINDDTYPQGSDSLWETYILNLRSYTQLNGVDGIYVTGIRCFPLLTAMQRLVYVYIITANLMVVILLLLWVKLRHALRNPLQRVLWFGRQNLAPIPEPLESKWKEPYLLEQGYMQVQQTVHQLRQENQQLQTALEYAKHAEENRRRLVSNITHELKTPLAIIHSYAEGLQEGIAREKQAQYLQIIVEETNRMDAMVLEMLDLSRLEAGKVRLASDTFSLLKVTQAVFDKLSLAAEEKGLTVEYVLAEDFPITADEGRITQVITNLVSNAIKYTPEGGAIRVKIYRHRFQTWFSIENTCPPLPEEALEKVWDSFYRVESSRTTKGTGLGLTIVKTIIQLHNGTCKARNTENGVEFLFILP